MSTEMDKWFLGDILKRREIGATAWSVLFNVAATGVCLAALLFLQTPSEPVTVLIQTIKTIFSPGSFVYLFCGLFCLAQLNKVYAKNAKATPTIAKSVLTSIKSSLSDHLISFIQFTCLGGALSLILALLSRSDLFTLYITMKEGNTQLNPVLMCVVFAGLFSGLQQGISYHFENGNYLQIPIINIDIWSQKKHNIQNQIFPTLMDTLSSFRYFYIGFSIFSWLGGFMAVHEAYHFMLSFTMVAATLISMFYVKLVMSCIKICMRAHTTVPLPSLSLDNMLEGASSESSLLSLLSLQSLAETTCESGDIRREIFSLSIPGGHPHMWNKLQSVTLKSLQTMNGDLGKLLSPPPPPEPKDDEVKNPLTSTPLHPNFGRRVVSPNMRMLAPARTEKKEANQAKAPAPPKWVESLNAHWNNFVTSLSKRPIIGWMINEPQDLSYREIFSTSQAAIYAAEILSYVVRASIEEDGYGVVQKDLPAILTALLKLEESVDRCRVLQAAGNYHHRKRSAEPADVQLKQELKCALKSAVYRITIAFKEHILVVPLEADLAKKISNCHNFLEA